MTKPKGYVIDKGNSPIDGKPFVVIMTMSSSNRKTGDMCQVFILRDDINPVEAVNTGEDFSICGNCPHRKDSQGRRSCYVNVGQAPNSVWKAYKRGAYKLLWTNEELEAAVSGRSIRYGAYGDPALISPGLVKWLNSCAKSWTGYTHQWRESWCQVFKGVFMASCDSFNDYLEASNHGFKCFSVVPKNTNPTYAKQCPATVENSAAQCVTCSLCNGSKRDVFVHVHGTGARHFSAA